MHAFLFLAISQVALMAFCIKVTYDLSKAKKEFADLLKEKDKRK